MVLDLQTLLRHAGELQRATSLERLLETTHAAIQAVTRYRNSWLTLFDDVHPEHVRVLRAGAMAQQALSQYPLFPRAGDRLLAELVAASGPVVVVDARIDPRPNPEVVRTLGSRTIVHVPMRGGERLLGALGVGTYGDEGALPPVEAELELLQLFAAQLGSALERVQLLEAHARDVEERHVLEKHLEGLQRAELLGLLASGVAHELNNNLAVVSSNLRCLDRGALSADDREALDDSMTATQRAIDVVQDLRFLGRARPGHTEAVDLNACVSETLRLVRSSVPRSITLEHQAGRAPQVRGDPEQLEHALASLIIHARDAVGARGVIKVAVDGQRVEPAFAQANRWARPGDWARVTVQDSGPGLPREVVERISDPHFLKDVGSSVSLGLAVVSRVVQHHEGLICAESAPGAGTRLHVFLPAAS